MFSCEENYSIRIVSRYYRRDSMVEEMGDGVAEPEKRLPPPPEPPEWPEHFPPCCPPIEAVDASGVAYLLVRADPPDAEDMKTAWHRGSHVGLPECFRVAVSRCVTQSGCVQLRKVSKRLRDHIIARGALTRQLGKMKEERSGHISIWLRLASVGTAHHAFKVV